MKVKFEDPIIGPFGIINGYGYLTEKKIKKLPNGKIYLNLLQEYVNNKFVKFKNISEVLKNYIKTQASIGCCVGEARTMTKRIQKYGVKKELPKNASITEVLIQQLFEVNVGELRNLAKYQTEGNKKVLKDFKKDGYNTEIDTKKIKKFVKKAENSLTKVLEIDKIKTDNSKNFLQKNIKKASKYIKKTIEKDNNVAFLINLNDKYNCGHCFTVGVKEKKPFFYDSVYGYARPNSKKELIKLLAKKYFNKREMNRSKCVNVELKPIHFGN